MQFDSLHAMGFATPMDNVSYCEKSKRFAGQSLNLISHSQQGMANLLSPSATLDTTARI